MEKTVEASRTAGEYMLPQEIVGEESASKKGEESVNAKSMRIAFVKGMKNLYRDSRKIKILVLMSTVWISIIFADSMGIRSYPVRAVEILTLGRVGEGLLELLGIFFGRIVYTYFVISVLIPALSGELLPEQFKTGVRKIAGLDYSDEKTLIPLITGVGLALITYNFLSGGARVQNISIGIICMVLSIRLCSNRDGILRGIIGKIMIKAVKKKSVAQIMADRIISGVAIGFGISVAVSLLQLPNSAYVLGILCIAGVAIYLGLEYRGGFRR